MASVTADSRTEAGKLTAQLAGRLHLRHGMKKPLEVTYHQVDKVPGLDDLIREQADRLERFCQDLMHCHVALERVGHGNHVDYSVRIDVTVPPHKELVVTRSAGHSNPKEALGPLVRDAFQTMQRRITDFTERRSAH
ncbi:MAG TPA: HPF/RaiA family ribosome-associated protein [Myxococcales bacterium LLY-WYZ-16_1]|nr:HPF/RaiA family ribosome-associated protein [Myxococcales bacterium LLY-WYZ-16_1]